MDTPLIHFGTFPLADGGQLFIGRTLEARQQMELARGIPPTDKTGGS